MAVNIAAEDGVFPLEETGDVLGLVRIAQFPVIIEAGDKKVIGDSIDRVGYRRLDCQSQLFSHIDAVIGIPAAHDGGKFGGKFGGHRQLAAHEQVLGNDLLRIQQMQHSFHRLESDFLIGFGDHLVGRQKMGPGGFRFSSVQSKVPVHVRIEGHELGEPEIEIVFGLGVGINFHLQNTGHTGQIHGSDLKSIIHPDPGDELLDPVMGIDKTLYRRRRLLIVGKDPEAVGGLIHDHSFGGGGDFPVGFGTKTHAGIGDRPHFRGEGIIHGQTVKQAVDRLIHRHIDMVVLLTHGDGLFELGDKLHVEQLLVTKKIHNSIDLFGIAEIPPGLT